MGAVNGSPKMSTQDQKIPQQRICARAIGARSSPPAIETVAKPAMTAINPAKNHGFSARRSPPRVESKAVNKDAAATMTPTDVAANKTIR